MEPSWRTVLPTLAWKYETYQVSWMSIGIWAYTAMGYFFESHWSTGQSMRATIAWSGNRGTLRQRAWTPLTQKAWQEMDGMHWQRTVERSRAKGEGGRKHVVKVRLVLSWSIEMNRWTGKEDESHELVGLLEFLFVPSMTGVSKWSVLEMHPLIELHKHSGKTPNNGQFLMISYTSLYIILDMYLYSKAPSPGVNDFGYHRTCFSCQVF